MAGDANIGKDSAKDPTVAMAELFATFYHFITKEIVDSLGEEKGKELVRRAVHKFGQHRGEKIRERVEKEGLPPDLTSLVRFYDFPASNLVETDVAYDPKSYDEVTKYCTFAKVWKELGAEDLGRIYCEQDFTLATGFNKDVKCSRACNIMDPGGNMCRFLMKL